MKIPENVKKELVANEVISFEVPEDRVRVVTYKKEGQDKTSIFFTLILNGVSISGCSVATSKEGKDFISFPSHADKSGKYRSDIYFVFSDDDASMILKEVERIINLPVE